MSAIFQPDGERLNRPWICLCIWFYYLYIHHFKWNISNPHLLKNDLFETQFKRTSFSSIPCHQARKKNLSSSSEITRFVNIPCDIKPFWLFTTIIHVHIMIPQYHEILENKGCALLLYSLHNTTNIIMPRVGVNQLWK